VKSRYRIVTVAIFIAMAGFLAAILFGDKGYMELRRLRTVHDRLQHSNARLGEENLQGYRTIDRLKSDPVYVEHVARRELGMIRADELIFTFKHPRAAKSGAVKSGAVK
jgi:cell division protein FtsB